MAKNRNTNRDDFENDSFEDLSRSLSETPNDPFVEELEMRSGLATADDDAELETVELLGELAENERLWAEIEKLKQIIHEREGNAKASNREDYGRQIVNELKKLVRAEQQENNQVKPVPALEARLNVLLKSYPNTWQ